MSFTSQLIIIIIHYASLLGLLICGLLSLIHSNRRKKLLFLILVFLFVGILSFVYYSGILVFIVGVFVIFFLVSLYLSVFQIEFFEKTDGGQDRRNDNKIKKTIGGIILPALFCVGIGYLFYIYTSDFLKEAVLSGNIYIVGLGDINKQFFVEYSPILVIVIASLFISFLWFIMISKD